MENPYMLIHIFLVSIRLQRVEVRFYFGNFRQTFQLFIQVSIINIDSCAQESAVLIKDIWGDTTYADDISGNAGW